MKKDPTVTHGGIFERKRREKFGGLREKLYLWPNFKLNFKFVQSMNKPLISRTLASSISGTFSY